MANISSFSLMILFLAIGAVMSSSAEEYKATYSPGPANSEAELPPEPQPGYYKYIEECAAKLTPKCGDEVYASVFRSGNVTDACCTDLVRMGQDCHDGLVQTIISMPDIKANASVVIPKSLDVWNGCVSIVEASDTSPSPSPSPSSSPSSSYAA